MSIARVSVSKPPAPGVAQAPARGRPATMVPVAIADDRGRLVLLLPTRALLWGARAVPCHNWNIPEPAAGAERAERPQQSAGVCGCIAWCVFLFVARLHIAHIVARMDVMPCFSAMCSLLIAHVGQKNTGKAPRRPQRLCRHRRRRRRALGALHQGGPPGKARPLIAVHSTVCCALSCLWASGAQAVYLFVCGGAFAARRVN